MKDFKNKKLYDMEVGLYDKFLNNKLTTKSEYNKFDDGSEEEEVMETSILGFGDDLEDGFGSLTSGDDFGSFGGFDDFGSAFGASDDTLNFDDWKQETPLNQFLKSPIFLTRYVFNSLIEEKTDDSGNKSTKFDLDLDHAKDFFKYVGYAGLFLFSTSILGQTVGLNTLHNTYMGMGAGVLSILGGEFFNWKYFNQGLISKFKPNPNPKADEISNNLNEDENQLGDSFNPMEENSDFDGFDFGNESENSEFSGFDFDNDSNVSKLNLMDDDDDEEFEEYDEEDSDNKILGPSEVDISDDYLYKQDLIKEFKKNERYKGKYLETRKETLDSFSGLLLNNDKSFTKWKHERERSVVYNNIAYTLYKALIDINGQFAKDEKEKVTILSIMYSPLLYKIELKLPQKYFGGDRLQKGIRNFENHLKRDAADTEVQCMVSMSGDTFIIRLLRLDYKGLISIGDILRYKDDGVKGTAYEQMINPKANTPMLVGLKDNEYPHVVDLEKNTAMAIVGGSGSGKSWLTYELGTNIVTTNDFNEVNFIVLDLKNAPFWQSFARMPHVIGYHAPNPTEGYTNKDFLDDALKISAEVVQECYRRQAYLNEVEMEDAIEARTTYKKNKQFDKLKEMPLLIFCIDEITSTMNELEEDKEMFDSFRNNLKVISQIGRSAGVRLLTVGQRAIDKSLPKNVRANTTLLFGMKMNAQSDFGMLFEGSKEVENMPKPTGAGQGIINSEDILGYHSLKTLTPGGKDTPQIRMLLRVMAFDWLRRASGREDLTQPPVGTDFKVAYNRPKFLELSYADLREGKLFNKVEKFPEVAIDLSGVNPVINKHSNVLNKTEDTNESDIESTDFTKYATNDFEESLNDNNSESIDNDNFNPDVETIMDEIIKPEEIKEISLDVASDFDDDSEDIDFDDEEIVNNFDVYSDKTNELDNSDEDMKTPYDDILNQEKVSSKDILKLIEKNKDTSENSSNDYEEIKENIDIDDFELSLDNSNSLNDYSDDIDENSNQEMIDASEDGGDDVFDILESQEIDEDLNSDNELETKLSMEKLKLEQEQIALEKLKLEQEKELIKQKRELEKEKLRLEQEKLELKKKAEKEKEISDNGLEKSTQLNREHVLNREKKEKTIANPNVINVGFNSSANVKNNNANKLPLKSYIIENGSKLTGDFSWAVSKSEIEKIYTKAEINRAVALGDVLESNDAYVTSL